MTPSSAIDLNLKQLPAHYDALAPDGSEIRLLGQITGGSLVHCTLPKDGLSRPVTHQTVEELWFFVAGSGQVWRKLGDRESIDDVRPGSSLTIPLGTHFQFRNTSDEPLCFVIATIPPWPGPQEAVSVAGHWGAP